MSGYPEVLPNEILGNILVYFIIGTAVIFPYGENVD
jgi:hypothetical protein